MSEWNNAKLSEVVIKTDYGYTASANTDNVGPKFLRITDIVPYYVDYKTVPYCVIDDKHFKQYKVEKGDLLIARTGATTGYNYLFNDDIDAVFASYLIRFRFDKTKVAPLFMKYIMKSSAYKGFINNSIGGSAQPGINAKVLGRFNFNFPDIATQNKIASILSTYDDLIEKNNRKIEILQEMAEELYKEWFVRFRFPGYKTSKFIDGIPEGWETVRLGTVMNFERGVSYSSKDIEDGQSVLLSMNNIKPYGGFIRDYSRSYSGKYKDFQVVHKNDLIMSITDMTQDRRIIGYVGLVTSSNKHMVICTHLIKITSEKYANEFLYGLFNYSGLSRNIAERATGTNVLGLTADILKKVKSLLPPDNLVKQYVNATKPIYEIIDDLENANENLKQQRDLLLPRLMSGKLEVKVS